MLYDMIWHDMIRYDTIYDMIWYMIYVICYMWYVVCDMWYNDTSYHMISQYIYFEMWHDIWPLHISSKQIPRFVSFRLPNAMVASNSFNTQVISHNLPGRLQATTNAHRIRRRMIKAVKFNASWLLGQFFVDDRPKFRSGSKRNSQLWLTSMIVNLPSWYSCSCWVITAM